MTDWQVWVLGFLASAVALGVWDIRKAVMEAKTNAQIEAQRTNIYLRNILSDIHSARHAASERPLELAMIDDEFVKLEIESVGMSIDERLLQEERRDELQAEFNRVMRSINENRGPRDHES